MTSKLRPALLAASVWLLVFGSGCASFGGGSGVFAANADSAETQDASKCECEDEDAEAAASADQAGSDQAGSDQAGAEKASEAPAHQARPPQAITSEEITFESRGDELTGVIDRPKTAGGPLPAVVILHDAGPLDRRGVFAGSLGLQLPVEVAVYQELAEALAQSGYMVLRYDKRTCVDGGPAGCDYPRSYIEDHREELAEALSSDAEAAVEALREQRDADPTRILLVGHGQGAELALAINEEVDASAMVLLSPSPYPVDEVILHQSEISLAHLKARRAREGNTTLGTLLDEQIDALAQTRDEQQEAFAALRAGEAEDSDVLDAPTRTWLGMFELHERAMSRLQQTRTPVLAIFGERDPSLPDDSAERFEEKMARLRPNAVESMPHTSRLMVAVDDEENDSTQISEAAHRMILEFLLETAETPEAAEPASQPSQPDV
ncbi:MAG: alpha/beta hydrolase family protein [Persicimonas sp.]